MAAQRVPSLRVLTAGEGADCCESNGQDLDLFSLTGTLDHALTDNLTVRVEGRYDWGEDNMSPDNLFSTARPA